VAIISARTPISLNSQPRSICKRRTRREQKQKKSHFPFFDVFQPQSIQESWTMGKKPVDLPLTSVRLITSAVPTTRQQHNAREKDIRTRFVIRRRHKIAHFHWQSFNDRNVPAANISTEHIHNQHDDRLLRGGSSLTAK
jgi:hypothetical protein